MEAGGSPGGLPELPWVYRFPVDEPGRELRVEVGDTTDELPRIVRARRLLHLTLAVFALVLFALAGALTVVPVYDKEVVAPETASAIDAEAQRLAMIFETTTKSVLVQAETMAGGPQIRAGVMTDAATVKDLVTSELQLPRNLNQTLEVVQLRDGARDVLLRLPQGSPPIASAHGLAISFQLDGREQLAVVVSVPIAPYDAASKITGELVLSTPLDFTLTRENLAGHAVRVELAGSGWRFAIIPASVATSVQRLLALSPEWKIPPLVLQLAPHVTAAPMRWVDPVRFAAAGVGLVLALVLGLSLYRTRDP